MNKNWSRDEIILACELTIQNGWRGLSATDDRVINLSSLLRRNPLHAGLWEDAKFRNPNGVARKTWDIASRHPDYKGKPTHGNKLDKEVLDEFLSQEGDMRTVAQEIRSELQNLAGSPISLLEELLEEEIEAAEGSVLLVRHLRRERSRSLRNKKIRASKALGMPVACEVCSFDYGEVYGDRGKDFIEVHHVLPLHASGPTRTKLQDLALLCANCHRMIHRGARWLTPVQLKELVESGSQGE